MRKILDKVCKYFKDFVSKNWVQSVIAFLGAMVIKLIFLTCSVEIKYPKEVKNFKKIQFIACLWHGRSMGGMFILYKKHLSGFVIASKHRDGRLMSKMLGYFNLKSIYGSTTSGATSVLRQGLHVLRRGKNLMLTPDGPKGPRMRMQDGAIYFAKMSGVPLYPICFSYKKMYVSKYWDRYVFIKPFSKVIIEIGEPFIVPKDISKEEIESYRKKFENIMIEQQTNLDKSMKNKVIEPEKNRVYRRKTI